MFIIARIVSGQAFPFFTNEKKSLDFNLQRNVARRVAASLKCFLKLQFRKLTWDNYTNILLLCMHYTP